MGIQSKPTQPLFQFATHECRAAKNANSSNFFSVMYRPPSGSKPKNPFFAIFASVGIFAGIFIAIYLIGQCVEKLQEYCKKGTEAKIGEVKKRQ